MLWIKISWAKPVLWRALLLGHANFLFPWRAMIILIAEMYSCSSFKLHFLFPFLDFLTNTKRTNYEVKVVNYEWSERYLLLLRSLQRVYIYGIARKLSFTIYTIHCNKKTINLWLLSLIIFFITKYFITLYIFTVKTLKCGHVNRRRFLLHKYRKYV